MAPAVVIDFGKRQQLAAASYFLLGLSKDGLWIIRETIGRKAGIFRTRKDAIRYARDESSNGNFTIVYQPGGLDPAPHDLQWVT